MFGGVSENDKKNFILAVIFTGVTLTVYFIFKYVLFLVAPFVIGLIVAAFLKKPVYFLKRRLHINLIVGTILVIVSVLGAGIFFCIYVGGRFVFELKKLLVNYDYYCDVVMNSICGVCDKVDESLNFAEGRTFAMVEENIGRTVSTATDNMLPVIMEKSVGVIMELFVWGGGMVIVITAVFFLIRDMDKLNVWVKTGAYCKWFRIFLGKLVHFAITYIKTQAIIMGITACICTTVMLIIGNGYPLMIGILIGIMDALPLFGTGIVLVPWTIVDVLAGNYLKAAVVFTGYCICYVVREFLEPKMMGGQMGIPPLVMLVAMYVGVLLFGIPGFVLGPAAYIVICEVMRYVTRVI